MRPPILEKTGVQPGSVLDTTTNLYVTNVQPWDGKTTIWRFRPEFALGIGYLFGNHVNAYVMFDHIGGSHNTEHWFGIEGMAQGELYESNEGVFGLEYKF